MWLRKILIKNYIIANELEEIRYLKLDEAIAKIVNFSDLTINLISHISSHSVDPDIFFFIKIFHIFQIFLFK